MITKEKLTGKYILTTNANWRTEAEKLCINAGIKFYDDILNGAEEFNSECVAFNGYHLTHGSLIHYLGRGYAELEHMEVVDNITYEYSNTMNLNECTPTCLQTLVDRIDRLYFKASGTFVKVCTRDVLISLYKTKHIYSRSEV